MAELTLISAYQYSLKLLIEAALAEIAEGRSTPYRPANHGIWRKIPISHTEIYKSFWERWIWRNIGIYWMDRRISVIEKITGKDRNFVRGSFC